MSYRAALIGCGRMGHEFLKDPLIKGVCTHAEAYYRHSDIDFVAVCDVDIAKARACAKRWLVKGVYSNVVDLIKNEKIQIVSICTPDSTHAEIIEMFLGTLDIKAIFVEKPISLDLGSAEKIVQIAASRNIVLLVNYTRRYAPGFQAMKQWVNDKKIGDIQSVSGVYTKGVFHNGTHWLDLARWILGDITAVQGFGNMLSITEDPTLDGWVQFKSGVTGFLHGLDEVCFTLFEMDIIGTLGRIRIYDSGHNIDTYTLADSSYNTGYRTVLKTQTKSGELTLAIENAVKDIVHCLDTQCSPRCSGEDGLLVLKIATSLVSSFQTGERVLCPF
jgi:predicted dehydrogenase